MDDKNKTDSGQADERDVSDRAVVSTTEAARQLGVSVRTIQLWVENGRLIAWKTAGNHRRIFQWSIDQYKQEEGQLIRPQYAPSSHSSEKPTILIIEDDRTTQVYYETMLQLLDVDDVVEFAGDGVEGMVAIGKYEPWLIFLDIDMPRLNGIEVVNMLERQKLVSTADVVVISNVIHEVAVQRGLPKKCAFYSKPISLENFRDVITDKRKAHAKRNADKVAEEK